MRRFTTFNAGSWSDLARHVFAAGPLRKAGKIFLSGPLQTTGAEISLNRLEAGEGYSFLHRHRTHEETYIVVSGQGEFLIDGERIPVAEGSVIQMAPAAVRTLRAARDAALCYVCIQAVAGTLRSRTVTDGELVPGDVDWS